MNYDKKLYRALSIAFFIVSVVCFTIGCVLLVKLKSEAPSSLSESSGSLVDNIFNMLKSIINYKEENIVDIIPSGIGNTMGDIGKIIGLTKKYKIMADVSIAFVSLGFIFILISLILFTVSVVK